MLGRSVRSAMNYPNPYTPPDKTAKSFQSASLSTTIAARLLGMSAIALSLVFACYGFVVGYEIMNRGANILPPAWPDLNILGLFAAVGFVIAIVGSRQFSRGRNTLLRVVSVFLLFAVLTVIAVSFDRLYQLGAKQTKQDAKQR